MMNEGKLKIWGRFNSGNVKKVLCLADALNLRYERIDAGGKFGVVDTPEYRRLNPNGRVPTIEDGNFVLWESNSILRYLAMRYDGEVYYPPDPNLRADIDRWLDWQLSTLLPADVPVFFGTIRTPPEQRDHEAIKVAARRLAEVLSILDAALAGKDYLVGGRLSLADIALGVIAQRWFANPFIPRPDMPNLKAWYERLRQWPPYNKNVDLPLE